MCDVACAVTVTMDGSLGWQCSVSVKVSVTLSCVVIVMGVRAEAAPAAAKATKAASMNTTVMRLTTHLLSSVFLSFRSEVSRDVSGRRSKTHTPITIPSSPCMCREIASSRLHHWLPTPLGAHLLHDAVPGLCLLLGGSVQRLCLLAHPPNSVSLLLVIVATVCRTSENSVKPKFTPA